MSASSAWMVKIGACEIMITAVLAAHGGRAAAVFDRAGHDP
jgi:hypothetical protein